MIWHHRSENNGDSERTNEQATPPDVIRGRRANSLDDRSGCGGLMASSWSDVNWLS